MFELKTITYEECRAEHFKQLMKKMERKIDYWQYRGRYSLKPGGELSRANAECSEAGMQYNFYKDALEALEDNKFKYEAGFVRGFEAAQPKWISVEERLPEENKPVLVFDEYNGVGISFHTRYTNSFVGLSKDVLFGSVTHWMPLPQAPEVEKDD